MMRLTNVHSQQNKKAIIINTTMIKITAVIIVSGRAFLRNLLNPLDKLFLSKLLHKETVCLKEWIKQKYKEKAAKGDNK